MIAWPENIPLPLVTTSGGPTTATLYSSRESLIVKRRSRADVSTTRLSARWTLNYEEKQAFSSFFTSTLHNGTAIFLMSLRYPALSELTQWRTRFAGGFSASFLDKQWQVSADLFLLFTPSQFLLPVIGWNSFLVVSGNHVNFQLPDMKNLQVADQQDGPLIYQVRVPSAPVHFVLSDGHHFTTKT